MGAMEALIGALVKESIGLVSRAIAGDLKAKEKLVDILGERSRLEIERTLDEAVISSLPEG